MVERRSQAWKDMQRDALVIDGKEIRVGNEEIEIHIDTYTHMHNDTQSDTET